MGRVCVEYGTAMARASAEYTDFLNAEEEMEDLCDLRSTDPREEMITLSKASPLRFWDALLLPNQQLVRADIDPQRRYVSGEVLYSSYRLWCATNCTSKAFTKFMFLRCIRGVDERRSPRINGKQRRVYVLP